MMATFDILALGLVGVSIAISMMRGIVHEIASLLTWIVAFIMARLFAQPFADAFLTTVQPPALASVAAFVLVFAAAWLAQYFLRSLLTAGIEAAGLGGVNRMLGGIFGAVRGVLVVTLVVLVCAFTDLPQTADWRNAFSAPFFETLATFAVPYLPDFLAEKVQYKAL